MTDLRTRIAAVVHQYSVPIPMAELVADAVIRELGLEPQAHYDPDCEFYRYVTDWIDPQTNQRVDLP